MIEQMFERLVYASRWILAPIYLGLSLALVALGIKFFGELVHLLPHILDVSETDMVLVVLSRMDLGENTEKLDWLGKMDTGSLKNKVAASIVAISSIHLLKVFMNADNISNDKLLWYVVIHLTFVLSAVAMGLLDKVTRKAH